MNDRAVMDIQTPVEDGCLYIRYNKDANVVNSLENDPPSEFIGEVILKICSAQAKRIKVKVYEY